MSDPVKEKFRFKLNGKTLVVIDWANVYGWFSDPKSKNYLGWEIDIKRLHEYLSSYQEIFDKRLYQGIEVGNGRSEDFGTEVKSVGFNFVSKEVKWVPVSLNKSHFRKLIKELFNALDGIKNTNSGIATKLYELKDKVESRLSAREPDFDSDGSVQGEHLPYTPEDQSVYDSAYDLVEELDLELKKLNISIDDLQKHLSEPVLRRKCDFDVEIARDVFNMSKDFDHLLLFSGDGDYSALVDDQIIKGKKVIVVFGQGHKGKEFKIQKGLFLCTAENLRDDIQKEKNIPMDFSTGRDTNRLADVDTESQ